MADAGSDEVKALRLLVVRTDQIADRALEIAAFGGFGPAQVAAGDIHEYRNPHKRRIVQEIPVAHPQAQMSMHCGPSCGDVSPRSARPQMPGRIETSQSRQARRQREGILYHPRGPAAPVTPGPPTAT